MNREFAEYIRNKRVTVLGLSRRSGIPAAKVLYKYGAQVFGSEKQSIDKAPEIINELQQIPIPMEFSGHTDLALNADIIVVSPGIPESNEIIQKARARGIQVWSEIELGYRLAVAPIIAITGSNGKSTTTVLIGHILKELNCEVFMGGNIGINFCEQADSISPQGYIVLEVSTFQLETIVQFRPCVSVWLNLTPDHLDRHGSMEYYAELKARIFKNQTKTDFAVLNMHDNWIAKYASSCQAKIIPFGDQTDFHVSQNHYYYQDFKLASITEFFIQGPHNQQNVLASLAAVNAIGIKPQDAIKAIQSFKGLPHRMELVLDVKGIKWINDSKATNPDSLEMALRTYPDNSVILIAGGRNKGSDFTPLFDLALKKCKQILLIGEAAKDFEQDWKKHPAMINVIDLKKAISEAKKLAVTGDLVLLSPGCASFDQFKDYEDRGSQFRQLVKLANNA